MANALRILPLGGLGEVGKTMTVFEYGDETIVIDAGLAFPRDEHLGVDLLLPDFEYLRGRDISAVILTHGHEDHVGALPYVLRELKVREGWATRLTLGLIKSKLDEDGLVRSTGLGGGAPRPTLGLIKSKPAEHGLLPSTELVEAKPEDGAATVGPFELEFIRV